MKRWLSIQNQTPTADLVRRGATARGQAQQIAGEVWFKFEKVEKFRRTCITTWLRSGVDPRTVMAYTGHADLETTLRYLRPAAAKERIDAVSEIKWY